MSFAILFGVVIGITAFAFRSAATAFVIPSEMSRLDRARALIDLAAYITMGILLALHLPR